MLLLFGSSHPNPFHNLTENPCPAALSSLSALYTGMHGCEISRSGGIGALASVFDAGCATFQIIVPLFLDLKDYPLPPE